MAFLYSGVGALSVSGAGSLSGSPTNGPVFATYSGVEVIGTDGSTRRDLVSTDAALAPGSAGGVSLLRSTHTSLTAGVPARRGS